MLDEIVDDESLRKLLSTTGSLVNVDYPTKDVKLHDIHCKYCNPKGPIGVKPSEKRKHYTGEFWYSDNRQEAISKAMEIAMKKGYKYSTCTLCKP